MRASGAPARLSTIMKRRRRSGVLTTLAISQKTRSDFTNTPAMTATLPPGQ